MARRVARAGGVGVARFDYTGVLWLKYVFVGQHSSIGGTRVARFDYAGVL
jgi:hypothetical protein